MSVRRAAGPGTNNGGVATDDPKNSDDLLSRRLSSGTEPSRAPAADDRASGSHLEDTQAFDTFHDDPGPTRETPARSAGTDTAAKPAQASADTGAGSGKPALLSDEEWAILGGGTAAGAGASAAGTSGAGKTGKTGKAGRKGTADVRGDRSREVDVPGTGRFGALDVIGTIWITLAMPFVLAAIAVRAVASGLFLKFEYFYRPGFPVDDYGFTSDDRLHYGSYAVDYLNNLDSSRYLADVVLPNGVPVFAAEEITHMADVKALVQLLYLVGVIAAVVGVVFALYLSRRTGPGLRHSIRWGALLTLVAATALAVLAVLGWDRFFTGFHTLFFDQGTWQFYLDDALIRLFPAPFWIDAGIAVGVIILLGALIPLLLSFMGAGARRKARKAERTEAKRTETV